MSHLLKSLTFAAATTALPFESLSQQIPTATPEVASPNNSDREPAHFGTLAYRFQHLGFPVTGTSFDTHGIAGSLNLRVLESPNRRWRLTSLTEVFWTSRFYDVTQARTRIVSDGFQEVNNLTFTFHPWRWLSAGARVALSVDFSDEQTQNSSSTGPSQLPHDVFGGIPTQTVTVTRDSSRWTLGLRAEGRLDIIPFRWLQVGGSVGVHENVLLSDPSTPNPDTSFWFLQARALATVPIGNGFFGSVDGRYSYNHRRDTTTGKFTTADDQLELRVGVRYNF